jgi:serine/threonine protein kinase
MSSSSPTVEISKTGDHVEEQSTAGANPAVGGGGEPHAAAPSLNDFEIGGVLGHGSFAVARVATVKATGERVALKRLIPRPGESDYPPRIKREFDILSQLQHPHVVTFHGFFRTPWLKSVASFVLELCDTDLFELMHKQPLKRFEEIQASRYLYQLTEGVKYCHSREVIHRDLKLENLLLKNGVLKLCDFGLSTKFSGPFRRGIYGTCLYRAPEMVQRLSYDKRIDIWSCGIILFEMIAGFTPFGSGEPPEPEIHEAILLDQVRFPDFFPDGAKELVLSVLKKNPDERATLEEIQENDWLKAAKDRAQ